LPLFLSTFSKQFHTYGTKGHFRYQEDELEVIAEKHDFVYVVSSKHLLWV
jgi:hypothetical protein